MKRLSGRARELLNRRLFAVLATFNKKDGSIQQSLMWYLLEKSEDGSDIIVMNTTVDRVKYHNMICNPHISVCIGYEYSYVTIRGTIELIDDPEIAQDDILRLAARYDGVAAAQWYVEEVCSKQHRITLHLKCEYVYAYFGTDNAEVWQQEKGEEMTISGEHTRLQIIRSILKEQSLPVQRSAAEVNLVVAASDADDCAVYNMAGNLSLVVGMDFICDQTICIFDVERGRYRAVLHGHTSDINDMAFTPDSHSLLSGSADSALRVWNVESGETVRVTQGYAVSLYDIDWSPDGMQLVSGDSDGCVSIWESLGGTPPRVLHGLSQVVWGVRWSPDGRYLACSGWDATIRLWDQTSGACVQMSEDRSVMLQGLAWSPDGSLLACGTYLQGVRVWDVTARRLHWIEHARQTACTCVAWSPDGTRLVSGGADGSVYLWDGANGTGQEARIVTTCLLGHHGKVMSVAWSPDGRLLVSGSSSGELFVWDVQREEYVQAEAMHPGMVYAVAWSRCGDRLISGGSDGRLDFWDVETAKCVSIEAAHRGTVRSLRVSPDGRLLASCGDDGAIRIWDLTSCELLRTLRRDRPYERLNITEIRGLTETEISSLQALGAVECDSFDPQP